MSGRKLDKGFLDKSARKQEREERRKRGVLSEAGLIPSVYPYGLTIGASAPSVYQVSQCLNFKYNGTKESQYE